MLHNRSKRVHYLEKEPNSICSLYPGPMRGGLAGTSVRGPESQEGPQSLSHRRFNLIFVIWGGGGGIFNYI